ncbi:AEC family transporter [Thiocapsa bogorovii]|nr:AEC family transporter [Thiocapsa bogorovii]UHD18940.1 AEC family transporter [Thiocapsa bogorovii]
MFAVVAVGFFYARRHRPDMRAATALNMDVFVPALVFSALASKDADLAAYGLLAFAGVALVLGSGLIAWPIARLSGIAVRTFVPPMMFLNSGNMGIPLLVLAFGEQAMPAAVVLFLIENVLHFSLGTRMLDRYADILGVLRTPVMLACIAGLAVNLSGVSLPEVITRPVDMLGQVSIPLMLFTLGVRLVDVNLADWRVGLLGAVIRPTVGAPLAWAIALVLALPPEQASILIVFAALPPAVLNAIFAERYAQEPERVASIVLLGNAAALITLPAVLLLVL